MAYKVFTNGSTLQASEINENLMRQSVATFSNAAARTAAITTPVEGQMTYLLDTDQIEVWSGSAWVRRVSTSLPFAQAAGTGYGGAASTVITYPAGRFSVAPIIIMTNGESTARNVTANTSSNFTFQNVGGANATYLWHAIQMTSTTAAG